MFTVSVVMNNVLRLNTPLPKALFPDLVALPSENDQASSLISYLYVVDVHTEEMPGTYVNVPYKVYSHSMLPSESLRIADLFAESFFSVESVE